MLNSCLIKTESLGFGYLGLAEQTAPHQLSFKLSPHSCSFFPEAELVSTPLRAQAVITNQHVSYWVKNMVFHFCSKENTIQKYDHNIPKETGGHFSQRWDVGDATSQSVLPANSAFK